VWVSAGTKIPGLSGIVVGNRGWLLPSKSDISIIGIYEFHALISALALLKILQPSCYQNSCLLLILLAQDREFQSWTAEKVQWMLLLIASMAWVTTFTFPQLRHHQGSN